MASPPVVTSFLIADTVLHDRLTGKWTVVGIFDRVLSPKFPVLHGSLSVYVRLTDAEGRYTVVFELRDGSDRRVSAFPEFVVEVHDRSRPVEFGMPTPMLPLEKPGRYRFVLLLNGEEASACSLDVVQIQGPPPAPLP